MTRAEGNAVRVVVVTGQTGTGKSTVCSWLAQRGAFVLDADRIGHEVLRREEMILRLSETFSTAVLRDDGQIDRARLGGLVFADPESLRALNALVHPPLVEELRARIATLRRTRAAELIVVDAALYFLFPDRLECDAVVLTRTSPRIQLQRITERDGLSEESARERLERQREILEHEAEADYVLDTSAAPSQVRRELLLNMDALLGTSLVLSDPLARNRQPEVQS